MAEATASGVRAARVQTLRLQQETEPRPQQPEHVRRKGDHVSYLIMFYSTYSWSKSTATSFRVLSRSKRRVKSMRRFCDSVLQ